MKVRSNGRARIDVSAKTVAILTGEDDLSAWSDEELIRGQRKASNGKWVGVPPLVVPQAVHAERARRLMGKAHDLLRESTVDAIELLRQVVTNEDAPLALRVQAADLVLARSLPKNVAVQVGVHNEPEPKFLGIIRAGLVIGGTPIVRDDERDVIDAEVIEDDDIMFEE